MTKRKTWVIEIGAKSEKGGNKERRRQIQAEAECIMMAR